MASTGISWRHVPGWAQNAGESIDAAMALLIVTSPIAVGGMLPWAQATWSFAAVVVLLATAAVHGATGARWRWETATVVAMVIAGFTLVRASTLASFLGGTLEAEIYAVWPHVDATGTAAPGRAPLAALRLLGAAAIFQVASVRFRQRGGRERVFKMALATCGLVVAIGCLQVALGFTQVYGVYEAQHVIGLRTPLAAPFINENQAGAMWGLGAVLLTCVATSDKRHRVTGVLGAVAAIGCTEFLLHSHAAATAAVISSLTILTVINLPKMHPRSYGHLLATTGITALIACAWVSWVILPATPTQNGVFDKAILWRDSLLPALSRPFGFGPGAYGDLYSAFATKPENIRFAFVESAPLQLALDHGWIAAFAIIGALTAVFVRRMRIDPPKGRDIQATTLGVAMYVGIEAITGMGLEAIGYLFPVAALLGMTAGRSIARSKQNATRRSIVVGVIATLVLTGLSFRGLAPSVAVGDDHVGDSLEQVAQDRGRNSEELRDAMATLAESVPADTMLLTYTLAASLRAGDIDRAEHIVTLLKELAPGRPVTWDFAVEVDVARGDPVAACASVHQMISIGGESTRVVQSLRRVTENPMEWDECANHEQALPAIYDGLHREGRADDALAIALRDLRQGNSSPPTLRAAFRGYRALGLAEQAVTLGYRLLESIPDENEVLLNTTRLLLQLDRHADALALLDGPSTNDRSNVALRLERLAVLLVWEDAPNRNEEFVTEYQQLVAYASRSEGTALRRLRLGAAFFFSTEQWIKAESAYRGILRLRPEDPSATRDLDRVIEARSR